MQFERGKPPETPNALYRAARVKDERWRSAGPGFELGRAGRLSLTSSQEELTLVNLTSPMDCFDAIFVDDDLLHGLFLGCV
jgi:hypothetical protein